MHKNINNLIEIKKKINLNNTNLAVEPNIIAVSKTFPIKDILPLLEYGHIHFGENKVNEAIEKWTLIKKKYQKINLHMIGRLQTNKVKNAVKLFDFIHSVDSVKLAEKISIEQKKINRNLKIFIQINIGDEEQKSGVRQIDLPELYEKCVKNLKLDVIGFMCIPPIDKDSSNFFQKMSEISKKYGMKNLSMGMSSDYILALKYNSNFLRIGTEIFGKRD